MEWKVERKLEWILEWEGDGVWVKQYGIWENEGRMKSRMGLGMGKWEMEWEWKKFSFIVVEEKDFLFWERKKFSFYMGKENFFIFGDISGKLF